MEEKSIVSNNKVVELQWFREETDLKNALQELLGCSGQLLKKFYSSGQLNKKIYFKTIITIDLNLANHLKINPNYSGPNLKIISEDENFIVIHKSFGIHSHPLKYEDTNTVLNYLITQGKWAPLKVNQEKYDRGLLYRLDEGTSGVIILAKNQKKFEEMRDHFKDSVKEKYYFAVVKGHFNKEGFWKHYFLPTGKKGNKQIVSEHERSDSFAGEFECYNIQTQNDFSLVLVKLKTGLRHQIRAQLSFLGFPILGDTLYGGDEERRIFLHAWSYRINDQLFQDKEAELFGDFINLDSAFKVSEDVIRRLKGI